MEVSETLYGDAYSYLTLAWNLVHHGVYSDAIQPPLVPHVRWPPGYPALLTPFFASHDFEAAARAAMAAPACWRCAMKEEPPTCVESE